MKRGTPFFRILTLAIITLACLGAIVGKLWWIQIVRGQYYTDRVQGGSRVSVRLPAVRGEIMDRNGIPLVENRASFEIDLYLPDIVRAYRKEKGDTPLRNEKRRIVVRGMAQERSEIDIVQIVNDTIIPRLRDLKLEENYNAERMLVHYRNDTLVPFNYREDLDFETMAKFLESNVGLPGIKADVKPVRYYPYQSLAAHILGYVGAEREVDREEARKFNFYQPDIEGKAQIEKAMNKYLRGTAGSRILQRDAKGNILEDTEELLPPVQGDDVFLTIDARLQYIVEDTLRAAGRAAAVVVDPNNGDILAMASVPSFDPNRFIPSISSKDWGELTGDETSPLLNRAINGYAPGSTYKAVTALAQFRHGNGNTSYGCSGGVSYGNTYMKCWIASKGGSHGTLNLEGAIKQSCNAYFYKSGNVAGIDNIVAIGNMLGLGQRSGLPLSGESPGILPGKEWLAENYPRDVWRPGYTANVSIGQGFVLASPLQMAMVTAAIANGGTVYYPRIVDRVVAQDGQIVAQDPAKVRANLVDEGGITSEDIEHIRKGMWKVVNESGGTARRARLEVAEVAGKTGTAQNLRRTSEGKTVKDNHTWFIAFAPYDDPKYAVCVLVQGAKSGGGVAAPVAARILEEAIALESGELEVEMKPLEPAVGNFVQIDGIDFGRDIPAATTATAEEVPTGTGPSQVSERPSQPAEPRIRAEPDDRGRVTQRETANEKKREERSGLSNFFNFGGGNESQGNDNSRSRPAPRNPFRR
ncbi:MAG: penicillin-binding protein 2 [Chthoniobacterales bacterium]